jgi:DNA-binding CsgD family transcriptional regulator
MDLMDLMNQMDLMDHIKIKIKTISHHLYQMHINIHTSQQYLANYLN